VERSRQKSDMLQGYGDAVLRVESLEKELAKARKHSAMLQSKLDGAFAQYHNEVQDMQAKSDELVRKNKSLRQRTKVYRYHLVEYLLWVPCCSMTSHFELFCRSCCPSGTAEGIQSRYEESLLPREGCS
jgi:FtsZ-binding cell division protein ZapB